MTSPNSEEEEFIRDCHITYEHLADTINDLEVSPRIVVAVLMKILCFIVVNHKAPIAARDNLVNILMTMANDGQ